MLRSYSYIHMLPYIEIASEPDPVRCSSEYPHPLLPRLHVEVIIRKDHILIFISYLDVLSVCGRSYDYLITLKRLLFVSFPYVFNR